MREQIYGVFSSIENAEQAIAALKDHGVSGNEVSVVRRSDGSGIAQIENEADHSITATSTEDVAAGALKGGAAGLALGILGSALALTIPGVGPILAAGPLLAALGTTAAATAAGAIGGGVVGLLVDQGVPTAAAARYNDAITRGDILVSVRSDAISTNDAHLMLSKYGATDVEIHGIGEPVTASASDYDPPIIDRTAEARVVDPDTPVTVAPIVSTIPAPPPATMATSPNATSGAVMPPETEALRNPMAPDVDRDTDEPVQPVPPQAAQSGLREIGTGTNRG